MTSASYQSHTTPNTTHRPTSIIICALLVNSSDVPPNRKRGRQHPINPHTASVEVLPPPNRKLRQPSKSFHHHEPKRRTCWRRRNRIRQLPARTSIWIVLNGS
ncbi:hypothetical protein V8G54_016346, partial [Vigna mungo]